MRNVKFISVFAAGGFVLSFVFGLFSHSSFISILLKAFIFGIVFVGLGFLISFLFNKFLIDSDSLDISNDGTVSGKDDDSTVGQNVDIVVEDEELSPSESDNHFFVGDNHQMLKSTDIKDEGIDSSLDNKSDNEYIPLRKEENSSNFSGTEAVSPNDVAEGDDDNLNADEDLDTLPDMESLSFSANVNSDNDEDENFSDSGFISSANTYKKSDGSTPDVKDAGLIAKAISSALAEEDSL